MESSGSLKKATSAIVLATTAALCAGWSASALSATTTDVECDGLTRDFRALEIPAETFSVNPVDHVSTEPGPAQFDSLDVSDAMSESAAPYLYLTPRVASVLRDIFDTTNEAADEGKDHDASSSPIAESDSVSKVYELIDESDRTKSEVNLPLFQQQMFRTDI